MESLDGFVSQKKEFKPGDLAVYIEIDSKCPESDERFTFSSEGGCRYPKKYEHGEKQNFVKGFLHMGLTAKPAGKMRSITRKLENIWSVL